MALGVLFLAGLALETAGRKVHIPRVTLLILLGAVVGQPLFDILPTEVTQADHVLVPTALTMVAFLLGGTLEREKLATHGIEIMAISMSVVVVGALVVSGGLAFAGVPSALRFFSAASRRRPIRRRSRTSSAKRVPRDPLRSVCLPSSRSTMPGAF